MVHCVGGGVLYSGLVIVFLGISSFLGTPIAGMHRVGEVRVWGGIPWVRHHVPGRLVLCGNPYSRCAQGRGGLFVALFGH